MTHIIIINPSCEPKMLGDTVLYSKERTDLGDINAIEHLSLRALKANGFEYEFVEVAETGNDSHETADITPQTPAESKESSAQPEPQAEAKTADEPQPQVADNAEETKAAAKDTTQPVKAVDKAAKKTETKTKKENSSSSKK